MSIRRVLKYSVDLIQPTTINLPLDARVVKLAEQGGQFMIWVDVTQHQSESTSKSRIFRFYGTGHHVSPRAVFIETIFQGPFVWHLFEEAAA